MWCVQRDHLARGLVRLPFVPHHGPGRFDSAMALNVQYAPIEKLRGQLENVLETRLDFLKQQEPERVPLLGRAQFAGRGTDSETPAWPQASPARVPSSPSGCPCAPIPAARLRKVAR